MAEKPMSVSQIRRALVEHIRAKKVPKHVQDQMIEIVVIQLQAISLTLGNLELLYLREAQYASKNLIRRLRVRGGRNR